MYFYFLSLEALIMKEVRGQEIISLDFCKEGGITEMLQQVVVDWVL